MAVAFVTKIFESERVPRYATPVTVRSPENKLEPWTAKSAPGVVVPIPTFPVESMMKAVEVADSEEVDTAKSGMFESEDVAETDKRANGDVVPNPTFPPKYVLPVPKKLYE